MLDGDIEKIIQKIGASDVFERQLEMSQIVKDRIELLNQLYSQNQISEEQKEKQGQELEEQKLK